MGQSRTLFAYFPLFPLNTIQKIDESIDGVLGTQTQGGRMEGADKSTELWRHSSYTDCVNHIHLSSLDAASVT